MSEIMQKYEKEAVKGDRIDKIKNMLRLQCTKEFVLQVRYTEKEYAEVQNFNVSLAQSH